MDDISLSVQDADVRSPVPRRWVAFIVCALIYLLVYFHRQAPAVLALDLMRDLKLHGGLLGLLGAAYFYPYALLQLVAGPITVRLGPRTTLCLFFGLAGLGAMAFAFAENLQTAMGCRMLVGMGAALVLIPVLEIVASRFRREAFTTMVGLLIGVAGLGVFAGSGPLSYLDHVIGWRGSFFVVGGFSLVLTGCAWCILKPSQAAPFTSKPRETPKKRGMSLRVLATSGFWPPVLWAFLALGVFISFGGLWGGPWLMHVHGLDTIETGHVLSMLALGMITGGPFLGFLSERVFKSRKKTLVLAALLLVALTAKTAFDQTMTFPELCVWFGLLGLCTMAAAPLSLTLVRNVFPDEFAPTATGLANFFFLAGGALMQQLGGWLLNIRGVTADGGMASHYEPLFLVYFMCALAALGAALVAREA